MPARLRSRTRVALAALALWLLLDLARSVHVRVGFDEPTQTWTPDPKEYAEMAWPPAATVPAEAPAGQNLYLTHCVTCHGPDGRGNGAGAPSMIPRPRDFTQGLYKYKTTAAGQPPSDDDLYRAIADGLHASGMPYWRDVLGGDEIRAVVAYLKTLSPVFAGEPATALPVPPRVKPDAASVARGKALYAKTGCAACHGEHLRGGVEQHDAKGLPVVSRDLTAPWTFRGGEAPEQIWRRLTTGLAPAPMPAYADTTTADERWDIVNFMLARARTPPWKEGGKLAGPGHEADLLQRGRYLVHAEMCGLCHTEVSARDVYRAERYLAGGMRVGAYPQGAFTSRNLTSDKETGLGDWSEQQVVDAIRRGQSPAGALNFWAMPWMYLHAFSDDDARAIARYLKSLPPVRNDVPRALRYGVAETLFVKLRGGDFPVARPAVLTYATGSYANRKGFPPDRVQDALGTLQWIVVAGGLLLLPFAAPAGRRLPRTWRGRLALVATVPLLAALLGAGWFVYRMPALERIAPERVVEGATRSIPKPNVSALPRERAALVERGRYLFNVASCAYCHGNEGAGGAKLSAGFGSLFVPNITSDRAAGLGAWSDAQVERAIRGGISRDGRPLHWQGMPWDHFSNWDEEDIRAIVAYVRLLPPVAEKTPPYRPPADDDCKIYTFWLVPSKEPGCK